LVTISGKQKFNVMVFWADPVICHKFRLRARVFKGVFAVVEVEATSESSFSGAGRAFDKQRTQVDPGQLCSTVYCVAGEKNRPRYEHRGESCLRGVEGPPAVVRLRLVIVLLLFLLHFRGHDGGSGGGNGHGGHGGGGRGGGGRGCSGRGNSGDSDSRLRKKNPMPLVPGVLVKHWLW
jgi:hypothetical protein